MSKLKTIESRVLEVLRDEKKARDDDMLLYFMVCQRCFYDSHGMKDIIWSNINFFTQFDYEELRGHCCVCQDTQMVRALNLNNDALDDIRECMDVEVDQPIISIDMHYDADNEAMSDCYIFPYCNLQELSSESPQGDLLQLSDQRQADRASGGRSAASGNAGGEHSAADGTDGGRDREAESGRSDEMDTPDEQSQTLGAGDRQGSSDIHISEQEQAKSDDEPAFVYDFYQSLSEDDKQRLSRGEPIHFDRRFEDRSKDFFGGDDDIKAILLSTPHLKASLTEIATYFDTVRDEDKQVEFIKSIFNNDYTEVIIPDGRRMGYKRLTAYKPITVISASRNRISLPNRRRRLVWSLLRKFGDSDFKWLSLHI